MDKFTHAYIEAALWSTNDESREDGGDPLDQNYGLEDIHSSTIAAMIKDCERFQEENRELLEASGQSEAQSGYDFWLTREGHG